MKRFAVGLIALILVAAVPAAVAAGRPVSGFHAMGDWAKVSFQQVPPELDCLAVYPWVAFHAGDHLATLGAGRPGPWSDTEVRLTIFDDCGAERTQLYDLYGWQPAPPTISSLESASVDKVEVLLSDSEGNEITAVVDLDWTGNDDPEVRVTNLPHDGGHAVETVVSANLSGALTFAGGNVAWDGMRPFTVADAWSVEMGRFVFANVAHP
jgi:hypothetical protein